MPSEEVTGAPLSSVSQGGKESELARLAAALAAAYMLLAVLSPVNTLGVTTAGPLLRAATCCYVLLRAATCVSSVGRVYDQVFFVICSN